MNRPQDASTRHDVTATPDAATDEPYRADDIIATYLIETAFDLEQAAGILAAEQSAGTFVPVPGETPQLLARHGARVSRIREITVVDQPSLPCGQLPRRWGTVAPGDTIRRARVDIAYPLDNIGLSLTALLTALGGNLYELSPFSGVKLLDFDLPGAFASYAGPQFGVAGTRRMADVFDRPLIGTIIKPSVGLSPEETAQQVGVLCAAGIDFIKDDELQTDSPHSPFAERVAAVMRVVDQHARQSGRRVMVAFNVTGDIDHMRRAHDTVVGHGGSCIMVNMLAVGLAGVEALCRHSQLPVHGHRAGWGIFDRHPLLGISYVAMQKLYRLAGIDQLHVNGLRNKFCEPDESVLESAMACMTPLYRSDDTAMPVFSSGQTVWHAAATWQALHSIDLLFLAGGGIMAHPDGPGAGVRSLRQAWDAALAGVPVLEHARQHPELQQALERFAPL